MRASSKNFAAVSAEILPMRALGEWMKLSITALSAFATRAKLPPEVDAAVATRAPVTAVGIESALQKIARKRLRRVTMGSKDISLHEEDEGYL